MQAVILAGGKGTRLQPLTYKIPKSIVLIKGDPFLAYQLNLLKKYNITQVLLCIGYLGEKIKDYFAEGKKLGINISYSIENELLGTGGAIKKAESLLEDFFLLLNGDTYLSIDYAELSAYFNRYKKMGVIVVCEKGEIKGNVKMEDGLIVDYKKNGDLEYLDAGVSIYSKKVLDLIPTHKPVSLEKEIYPKLINQKQLMGYLSKERFYDVGTYEGLSVFKERIK